MMNERSTEFLEEVGIIGTRNFKVRNSWGVYDYFKYYRKNRPKDKKYVLTEGQYYKIIRMVNSLLAEELLNNHYLMLPHKMGELEIFQTKVRSYIVDGKVKTNRSIDWDETLKLWFEDEQMRKEKRLMYKESTHVPRFRYIKTKAKYPNRAFYEIKLNTELKRKICKSFDNKLLCFENVEIKNLYNG